MEQVRSFMVTNVEVVRPDSTIKEAADKMRRLNIGFVPVFDGSRVVGIITDRDICVRAVAQGLDPNESHASDIMSRDVLSCTETESIGDALDVMHEHRVGRLVVLDRNNKLRGILSLGDLARHYGEDHFSNLIIDKIGEHLEPRGYATRSRGGMMGSRFGTIFGLTSLATLVAGLAYYRKNPEFFSRIKSRVGKKIGEKRAA